jgi:hypothetical protein
MMSEAAVKDPDELFGKLIILNQFDQLDVDTLEKEEIDANKEEIEMEIEALESILMNDFSVIDNCPSELDVQTSLGVIKLPIIKSVSLKVYPEESIPTQLTKILSSKSNDPTLGHNEEFKEEKDVKIRISKLSYLPSFTMNIHFPVSYPSRTPLLFCLSQHELYPDCEKLLQVHFEELFEEGTVCAYECHSYLQQGFVHDYVKHKNISSLKHMVTNNNAYDEFKNRSRDTFKNKFAKELKT